MAIALCVAILAVHLDAQECRVLDLSRLDDPAGRALAAVGDPTRDVKRARVFLTADGGDLLVLTNYITPGRVEPSRLLIDSDVSLQDVVLNLFWDGTGDAPDAQQLISQDITFIVDEFQLNRSRYSQLDFSTARRIERIAVAAKRPQIEQVINVAGTSVAGTVQAERHATRQSPREHEVNDGPLSRNSSAGGADIKPTIGVATPSAPVRTTMPESAAPTRAEINAQPKTFVEAFLAIAWITPLGRMATLAAVFAVALFAVWHTFPDATKERILRAIMKWWRRKVIKRRRNAA